MLNASAAQSDCRRLRARRHPEVVAPLVLIPTYHASRQALWRHTPSSRGAEADSAKRSPRRGECSDCPPNRRSCSQTRTSAPAALTLRALVDAIRASWVRDTAEDGELYPTITHEASATSRRWS